MASQSDCRSAGPLHLVLVDGNAPWVRALFNAMPPHVQVSAFRTCGPIAAIRRPAAYLRDKKWRAIDPRWREQTVLVPSWSRLPRLTTTCWAHRIRQCQATARGELVIVYTLPYYAGLVPKFPTVPQVYFAFDPYGCYAGWDPQVVAAGEKQLLSQCDAAFAISTALAEDFRKQANCPVYVQPNGISQQFLQSFDAENPAPDDLPAGGAPVVGCVGQIGRAYDWDLLDAVVTQCPDLRFVFVGPIFEEGAEVRKRMDRLRASSNFHYLGPKPHDEVPKYIQHFDVCMIPLRLEPCNHRRSLLRVFDYLASGRPVVSTAVASAVEHSQFVEICRDSETMSQTLNRLCSNRGSSHDRQLRRDYLSAHTWEKRAELFLDNVRSAMSKRKGNA